jgi:homoserine kinase
LKTSDSRRILKRDIPLGDVTRQCANVAGFITGLFREDYDLVARSMHDLLAEPKRLQLIPGYEMVKNAAIASGATGCGISGSGPSVFALCHGELTARNVSGAMQEALKRTGLPSDAFVSNLSAPGAHIIE